MLSLNTLENKIKSAINFIYLGLFARYLIPRHRGKLISGGLSSRAVYDSIAYAHFSRSPSNFLYEKNKLSE